MKNVKFKEIKKDAYFEYHLPCGEGLLEASLFYNKMKSNELYIEKFQEYLWNSGITYLGSMENSFLYAFIIEILSVEETVDIITFGDYSYFRECLQPIQSKVVEWRNSFEYTIDEAEGLCREYGYQIPLEFLETMNYFNKDLTNRNYRISKIKLSNIFSYIKTYNSDVTSWSFLINSEWEKTLEILSKKEERPKVSQMLRFSEYIVNIQIGEDEGYLDYIFIQSKNRLTEKIRKIEKVIFELGKEMERIIEIIGEVNAEWKVVYFKEEIQKIKTVANK